MTNQKTIKLNDGNDAPIYAYGTSSTLFGEDAQAAVMMSITEAGVHHIDTAACYSNEDSVGRAIGLKRLHTFVTTKCKLPENKLQICSDFRSKLTRRLTTYAGDENVPPKRSLESSLKVVRTFPSGTGFLLA
jgi:diketogulonate reductase-like aldo/keto reductase